MENKENQLAVLSSRRRANAYQQLKTIVLECYEIYGEGLVKEVFEECDNIFKDYIRITSDLPDDA